MTRGRRSDAARLLGRLEGSATARARLEIILQTLTGRLPLAQACRQLELSERRLYDLRQEALQAADRSSPTG
jgi:hypothetical protein